MTQRLAALVRRDAVPVDCAEARVLVAEARRHRLIPLLAQVVSRRADVQWPPALRAGLAAAAAESAALEYIQRLEIARLLAGLAERRIRPILMKGAALAYTVYSSGTLRPHDDIDLLVGPDDRGRACDALRTLGYEALAEGGGDVSFAQAHFRTVDRVGVTHTCDLHWRIANPIAFRDMVTFEELDAGAIPVPALSPHARTFGVPHALFLACVHRAAHHLDDEVLIWIYDLDRLVAAASLDDLRRFEELAIRAAASAVCVRGLEAAMRYFDTRVPDALLARLRAAAARRREPSAAFLNPELRPVDLLGQNLAALSTWRARIGLLAEHLFPSPAYMRTTFAPGSRSPLAWLYASRVVRGAPKWFRPSSSLSRSS